MKDELTGGIDDKAKQIKANYEAKMGVVKGDKQKKLKGSERRKIKAQEKEKIRSFRAENKPYFIWAGLKLLKPKDSVIMFDEKFNIFADKDVEDFTLDHDAVKINYDNGDFLLILKRLDSNEYKYAALTVTTTEILKAREQRLQLAYTGGLITVVSLLERDLGIVKPESQMNDDFIEQYKEDFLSVFAFDVIAKDIERIIKTLH